MYGANQLVSIKVQDPGQGTSAKSRPLDQSSTEGSDFGAYYKQQLLAAKAGAKNRDNSMKSKSESRQADNNEDVSTAVRDQGNDKGSPGETSTVTVVEYMNASLFGGWMSAAGGSWQDVLGLAAEQSLNGAKVSTAETVAIVPELVSQDQGIGILHEAVSAHTVMSAEGMPNSQAHGAPGTTQSGQLIWGLDLSEVEASAATALGEVRRLENAGISQGALSGFESADGFGRSPGQKALTGENGTGFPGFAASKLFAVGGSTFGATVKDAPGARSVEKAIDTAVAEVADALSEQQMMHGDSAAGGPGDIDEAITSLAVELEAMDSDSWVLSTSLVDSASEALQPNILSSQRDAVSFAAKDLDTKGLFRAEMNGKQLGDTYLFVSTTGFGQKSLLDGDAMVKADAEHPQGMLDDHQADENILETSSTQRPTGQVVPGAEHREPGLYDSLDLTTEKSEELTEGVDSKVAKGDVAEDLVNNSSTLWADVNFEPTPRDVSGEAEATRQLPSPQEIVDQLVERVRIGRQAGVDEMHIQLKPDWLGEVKVKIAVENGQVVAHFTAESQTVKSLLESGMSLLRENLENQGFALAEFTVDVSTGQAFADSAGFGGNEQGYYQPRSWMPQRESRSVRIQDTDISPIYDHPGRTRYPVGDNLVDYIV